MADGLSAVKSIVKQQKILVTLFLPAVYTKKEMGYSLWDIMNVIGIVNASQNYVRCSISIE